MDVIKTQSRGARVGCHGIFNFSFRNSTGFTLLELIAALAILSVLFGLGIPSINSTVTSNRVAHQVNQLVGTLAYSRSEAIKRAERITLCQSQNNTNCDKSGDWTGGWMLFVDKNNNRVLDESEKLLHVNKTLTSSIQVSFNGSGGRDGYVVYKADGSAYPNGSFIICNPTYPSIAKALILKHNGRLRTSNKTSQGKEIKCSPVG